EDHPRSAEVVRYQPSDLRTVRQGAHFARRQGTIVDSDVVQLAAVVTIDVAAKLEGIQVHKAHRTGQPGAHQSAVEIKLWLLVLIDHRDVRPATETARIDQRRRHVEISRLVDTHPVGPDRDTNA